MNCQKNAQDKVLKFLKFLLMILNFCVIIYTHAGMLLILLGFKR